MRKMLHLTMVYSQLAVRMTTWQGTCLHYFNWRS